METKDKEVAEEEEEISVLRRGESKSEVDESEVLLESLTTLPRPTKRGRRLRRVTRAQRKIELDEVKRETKNLPRRKLYVGMIIMLLLSIVILIVSAVITSLAGATTNPNNPASIPNAPPPVVSQLSSPFVVKAGATWMSPSLNFTLSFYEDLVLSQNGTVLPPQGVPGGPGILWAANANALQPLPDNSTLSLQPNGILQIVDPYGEVRWQSSNPPASTDTIYALRITNTPEIQIIDVNNPSGVPLWTNNSPSCIPTELCSGDAPVGAGFQMLSSTGKYIFIIQSDENMITKTTVSSDTIWESNTTNLSPNVPIKFEVLPSGVARLTDYLQNTLFSTNTANYSATALATQWVLLVSDEDGSLNLFGGMVCNSGCTSSSSSNNNTKDKNKNSGLGKFRTSKEIQEENWEKLKRRKRIPILTYDESKKNWQRTRTRHRQKNKQHKRVKVESDESKEEEEKEEEKDDDADDKTLKTQTCFAKVPKSVLLNSQKGLPATFYFGAWQRAVHVDTHRQQQQQQQTDTSTAYLVWSSNPMDVSVVYYSLSSTDYPSLSGGTLVPSASDSTTPAWTISSPNGAYGATFVTAQNVKFFETPSQLGCLVLFRMSDLSVIFTTFTNSTSYPGSKQGESLIFPSNGGLAILDSTKTVIWSSGINVTDTNLLPITLVVLDTGFLAAFNDVDYATPIWVRPGSAPPGVSDSVTSSPNIKLIWPSSSSSSSQDSSMITLLVSSNKTFELIFDPTLGALTIGYVQNPEVTIWQFIPSTTKGFEPPFTFQFWISGFIGILDQQARAVWTTGTGVFPISGSGAQSPPRSWTLNLTDDGNLNFFEAVSTTTILWTSQVGVNDTLGYNNPKLILSGLAKMAVSTPLQIGIDLTKDQLILQSYPTGTYQLYFTANAEVELKVAASGVLLYKSITYPAPPTLTPSANTIFESLSNGTLQIRDPDNDNFLYWSFPAGNAESGEFPIVTTLTELSTLGANPWLAVVQDEVNILWSLPLPIPAVPTTITNNLVSTTTPSWLPNTTIVKSSDNFANLVFEGYDLDNQQQQQQQINLKLVLTQQPETILWQTSITAQLPSLSMSRLLFMPTGLLTIVGESNTLWSSMEGILPSNDGFIYTFVLTIVKGTTSDFDYSVQISNTATSNGGPTYGMIWSSSTTNLQKTPSLISTPSVIGPILVPASGIQTVLQSPSGRYIAGLTSQGMFQVWDVKDATTPVVIWSSINSVSSSAELFLDGSSGTFTVQSSDDDDGKTLLLVEIFSGTGLSTNAAYPLTLGISDETGGLQLYGALLTEASVPNTFVVVMQQFWSRPFKASTAPPPPSSISVQSPTSSTTLSAKPWQTSLSATGSSVLLLSDDESYGLYLEVTGGTSDTVNLAINSTVVESLTQWRSGQNPQLSFPITSWGNLKLSLLGVGLSGLENQNADFPGFIWDTNTANPEVDPQSGIVGYTLTLSTLATLSISTMVSDTENTSTEIWNSSTPSTNPKWSWTSPLNLVLSSSSSLLLTSPDGEYILKYDSTNNDILLLLSSSQEPAWKASEGSPIYAPDRSGSACSTSSSSSTSTVSTTSVRRRFQLVRKRKGEKEVKTEKKSTTTSTISSSALITLDQNTGDFAILLDEQLVVQTSIDLLQPSDELPTTIYLSNSGVLQLYKSFSSVTSITDALQSVIPQELCPPFEIGPEATTLLQGFLMVPSDNSLSFLQFVRSVGDVEEEESGTITIGQGRIDDISSICWTSGPFSVPFDPTLAHSLQWTDQGNLTILQSESHSSSSSSSSSDTAAPAARNMDALWTTGTARYYNSGTNYKFVFQTGGKASIVTTSSSSQQVLWSAGCPAGSFPPEGFFPDSSNSIPASMSSPHLPILQSSAPVLLTNSLPAVDGGALEASLFFTATSGSEPPSGALVLKLPSGTTIWNSIQDFPQPQQYEPFDVTQLQVDLTAEGFVRVFAPKLTTTTTTGKSKSKRSDKKKESKVKLDGATDSEIVILWVSEIVKALQNTETETKAEKPFTLAISPTFGLTASPSNPPILGLFNIGSELKFARPFYPFVFVNGILKSGPLLSINLPVGGVLLPPSPSSPSYWMTFGTNAGILFQQPQYAIGSPPLTYWSSVAIPAAPGNETIYPKYQPNGVKTLRPFHSFFQPSGGILTFDSSTPNPKTIWSSDSNIFLRMKTLFQVNTDTIPSTTLVTYPNPAGYLQVSSGLEVVGDTQTLILRSGPWEENLVSPNTPIQSTKWLSSDPETKLFTGYFSNLNAFSPCVMTASDFPFPETNPQNINDPLRYYRINLDQNSSDLQIQGQWWGSVVTDFQSETQAVAYEPILWTSAEETGSESATASASASTSTLQISSSGSITISSSGDGSTTDWTVPFTRVPTTDDLPLCLTVVPQQILVLPREGAPSFPSPFFMRPSLVGQFRNISDTSSNGSSFLISDSKLQITPNITPYSAPRSLLRDGETLVSPQGKYQLQLSNGVLTLSSVTLGVVIWTSQTQNVPTAYQGKILTLRANGDLWLTTSVIDPDEPTAVLSWASNSANLAAPKPPYRFVVTDTGHTFVLDATGFIQWDRPGSSSGATAAVYPKLPPFSIAGPTPVVPPLVEAYFSIAGNATLNFGVTAGTGNPPTAYNFGICAGTNNAFESPSQQQQVDCKNGSKNTLSAMPPSPLRPYLYFQQSTGYFGWNWGTPNESITDAPSGNAFACWQIDSGPGTGSRNGFPWTVSLVGTQLILCNRTALMFDPTSLNCAVMNLFSVAKPNSQIFTMENNILGTEQKVIKQKQKSSLLSPSPPSTSRLRRRRRLHSRIRRLQSGGARGFNEQVKFKWFK